MSKTAADEKIIMDLGDFVPEKYELKFSIDGHKYRFEYEEARTDEVLALMNLQQNAGGPDEDFRDFQRKRVTTFLQGYLVEGEKEQLAEDLKKVPYSSNRGALDIKTIYDSVMQRLKKKAMNGEPA